MSLLEVHVAADLLNFDRRRLLVAGGAGLITLATGRIAAAQTSGAKVKIGVIGGGHIGGTIGGLWVKAGHPVLFSSRHPEELKSMVDGLGPLAKAGSVADALDFGEVILIAVPYKAIPELAKDYGPKFVGKIVIDPANAVARRDGEELLAETKKQGIGITTETYLKGSHVVRAFNSMGVANFVSQAHRSGDLMAIPMAGDDAHAVEVASQLVRDAGFDPVVVPLQRAQEFAQGGPLYNQQLTAKELRERFGLAK
jgi:predicted dinucleotide-binding enzyme